MKIMRKVLSLLIAIVMTMGTVVVSKTARAADDLKQTTKSVTVHKLVPNKKDEKTKYTMEEIKNQIESLTGDKKYVGQELDLKNNVNSAKEIPDVYFVWTNDEGKVIDESGNIVKDKSGKEIVLTDDLKGKLPEGVKDIPSTALAGLTEKDTNGDGKGYKFDTSKLKAGTYKIYEIHSLSKYKGDNGETLTNMLAVPVVITLPLNDIVDAHVYPKNIEDKPQIDKNFEKGNNLTEIKPGKNGTDNDVHVADGAKYENYQKNKATATGYLGQKVPFEVKTKIPANSHYKTAVRDDIMTKGLKYNKDLVITGYSDKEKLSGDPDITFVKNTDYEITETNNSYFLKLTQAGLDKINGKDKEVTLFLRYTATIDGDAEPDVTDNNDVVFHYGNNDSHSNAPISTNPTNKELKVTKNFPDEKDHWVDGETVEVTIFDAETGKQVDFTKYNKDHTEDQQNATVTLTVDKKTHTRTGLDDSKQYIIKEKFNPTEEVTYKKNEDGSITIEDRKSNNPTPLNPSEPKVVTGGKKFVKADKTDGTRLEGAEFVVKNSDETKYLAEKTINTTDKENKDYNDAEKAYNDAITAYKDAAKDKKISDENPVTINGNEFTSEEEAKAKIKELKDDRDAKYKKANMVWERVTDKSKAYTFTSDNYGKFEVKGLAYGDYKLEETKAPAGYAEPSNEFGFKVEKGSYTKDAKGVVYEGTGKVEKGEKPDAQRIDNKKVTIPETGGIGSVIFVVAGLAIMGLAVYKIKANKEEAR